MENNLKSVTLFALCVIIFIQYPLFGSYLVRNLPFTKKVSQKWRTSNNNNNVIILLDPEGQETISNLNTIKNAQSITRTLVQALQEKAAPIILSSSLMNNICFFHVNKNLQPL